jgi:hypothetical protein
VLSLNPSINWLATPPFSLPQCNFAVVQLSAFTQSINQLDGNPTVFPSSVQLCCGAIECFHSIHPSINWLATPPFSLPQ